MFGYHDASGRYISPQMAARQQREQLGLSSSDDGTYTSDDDDDYDVDVADISDDKWAAQAAGGDQWAAQPAGEEDFDLYPEPVRQLPNWSLLSQRTVIGTAMTHAGAAAGNRAAGGSSSGAGILPRVLSALSSGTHVTSPGEESVHPWSAAPTFAMSEVSDYDDATTGTTGATATGKRASKEQDGAGAGGGPVRASKRSSFFASSDGISPPADSEQTAQKAQPATGTGTAAATETGTHATASAPGTTSSAAAPSAATGPSSSSSASSSSSTATTTTGTGSGAVEPPVSAAHPAATDAAVAGLNAASPTSTAGTATSPSGL